MNRKVVSRPTSSQQRDAKKIVPPKFVLEKIIGNTAVNTACMAVNPITNDVAYCAGCVLVVYSPKRNRQTRFLQNKKATKTSLSCVAFSSNGKYVAAGESGFEPAVIIWDLASSKILCEIKNKGHKYGISCIAFSPDGKYLVSVGNEHDQFIKLWDVPPPGKGVAELLATKKISRKTYDVTFSEDGSFFVTASDKMVKYWRIIPRSKKQISQIKSTIDIEGKKCTLNAFQDATFVSVATGKMSDRSQAVVYCVTNDGHLCLFGENRMVDKWVKLKVDSAHSISVTNKYICCGCSDGFIRLFEPGTLHYKATLPKPPPVQSHLIANNSIAIDSSKNSNIDNHAIAVKLYPDSSKLVAIYHDRSFFVWDIADTKQIAKYRSSLAHSDYIWDIAVLPPDTDSPLPDGTFVTCSSDNTIRLWNVDNDSVVSGSTFRQSIAQKNIFCRDLLHVIQGNEINQEKKQEDHSEGSRCVKFTPDGCYIVSGDRQGSLRMHDVFNFTTVWEQSAHDAEILTIDVAQINHTNSTDDFLLASGGRDRLIHVFHVNADNMSNCKADLITSLDDHSASITSLKIDAKGEYLVSGSADKSVVFRKISRNETGECIVNRLYSNQTHGTIYDMDLDPAQQYVITAGQDKKLTVWSKEEGRQKRQYKTDVGINQNGGEPIKVHIGPGGLYTLTSTSDKYICLFDFMSGSCYSRIRGHSELITGLRFTNNCQRLITVSADGCIFIWAVAQSLSKAMQERMAELQSKRKSVPTPIITIQKPVYTDEPPSPPKSARSRVSSDQVEMLKNQLSIHDLSDTAVSNAFTPTLLDYASETQLPQWFKKKRQQMETEDDQTKENGDQEEEEEAPERKNKWVERMNKFTPFTGQEEANKWFQETVDDDDETLYASDEEVETPNTVNTSNTSAGPTDEEDSVEQQVVFGPETNESIDFKVDKDDDQIVKTDQASIKIAVGELERVNESDEMDSMEDDEEESEQSSPAHFQISPMDFLSLNYQNLDKPFTPSMVGRPSISSDFFRKSVIGQVAEAKAELTQANQDLILPKPNTLFASIGSMISEGSIPARPPPTPDVTNSMLGRLALFKKKKQEKTLKESVTESQELVDRHKQLNDRLNKYTEFEDEDNKYSPTVDAKTPEEDEERSPVPNVEEQFSPQQVVTVDYEVPTPFTQDQDIKVQFVPETSKPEEEEENMFDRNATIVTSPVDITPTISNTPRVQRHDRVMQSTFRVNKLKLKLSQAFEEMEEMFQEGASEEELNDLRNSVTDLYQSVHNFVTKSSMTNSLAASQLSLTASQQPQFSLTSTSTGQSSTVTSDRLDTMLEHYSDMLMQKVMQKLSNKQQ
jgi:WD40 repeat protein